LKCPASPTRAHPGPADSRKNPCHREANWGGAVSVAPLSSEAKGGQVTLWRTDKVAKVSYGPEGEDTPFEFHVEDFEKAANLLESKSIRVKRFSTSAGVVWDPFGNAFRVHDHRNG